MTTITTQIRRSNQNTHRRLLRIAVSFFVLTLVFTCGILVHAFSASTPVYAAADGGTVTAAFVQKQEAQVKAKTVEVDRGDTLWSIAHEYAPKNTDPRVYVDKIMQLNGLSKSNLKIGQILILP